MEDLLAHPAIQGGVAPFLVALLISLLFVRASMFAGLAIVAGFITTVFLTTGITFEPLTSTRKIVLLVIVVSALAFFFHAARKNSEVTARIFYLVVAAAIIWILWPVLKRSPLTETIVPVISYLVYAVWMIKIFFRMNEQPAIVAGTAATATGFAIGGCALIGASALLGQMGLAFGAAGAAYLFAQLVFRNEADAGLTVTLISGLIAALLLPAAIVYAKVPWIVLLIVATIPVIAFYPFEEEEWIWKNTISLLAFAAIPIGLAYYITVQSAGAVLM